MKALSPGDGRGDFESPVGAHGANELLVAFVGLAATGEHNSGCPLAGGRGSRACTGDRFPLGVADMPQSPLHCDERFESAGTNLRRWRPSTDRPGCLAPSGVSCRIVESFIRLRLHQVGVQPDPRTSPPGISGLFGFSNCPGRVHEPDVAESLGKVAQELAADGIDFLREQADVVDEGCGSFEDGAGPSRLSSGCQSLGQPKGTQKEGAFLTRRARLATGSGTPARVRPSGVLRSR